MRAPVLASPALLGTAQACAIKTLEGLEALLHQQYTIQELSPIGSGLQAGADVQLEVAAATCGDIGLISVQGSPMALAVEPKQPQCVLALPSAGWGQYQMDSCRIDNSAGETIAFIPPCGWRLVNDVTGGTAIRFGLDALITRMQAMAGGLLDQMSTMALLSVPCVLKTDDAGTRYYYQQLLGALDLLDSSYRDGPGEPDPRLGLDDLMLRCIALLLQPRLRQLQGEGPSSACRSLARAVRDLMDWMIANMQRPITLTELELRANYGRRTLQLGFKQEVGCGPMQWLRRQRLESALQLLLKPGAKPSITQVAQSCGYLNLSSFSRDFHERFGRTPSQVWREVRASLPESQSLAGSFESAAQPPPRL